MKILTCKILGMALTATLLTFSLTACSGGGSDTTSDSATGTVTTLSGTAQ